MGLEKIAEYKKKLGITTAQLSKMSGVPLGTLNKILSGSTQDPKRETLKAIAKVLGLTLNDFDDIEVNSTPASVYKEMAAEYTRNKKYLSLEEKLQLIRLILSDNE